MRGDFHIHTTYSDGRFSLLDVIKMAKEAKLNYISITDHDVLKGSLKAKELENDELKLIVGLELSTELNHESVHILGYFSDLTYVNKLDKILEAQRLLRKERANKIKEKLKEHFNIDLNMDFVENVSSITRGTIADEIIKQGFPYSKKDIFDQMIGQGKPAYFPSTKLDTQSGINLIHECCGLAVLAHPVLIKNSKVEDIIDMGVDGIEAIYYVNTIEDTKRFIALAKEKGLFITAGSDFHSINDLKHGNIGDVYLEGEHLDVFLKKLMEVNK